VSEGKESPMREIRLFKVVVNIGVGEAGERLQKAEQVLEMVTGHKPVRTISKTTNRDLGIRAGMPIGCKVTLRGKDAEEFVKKALWIRENKVNDYSFDPEGNLSFGLNDYTDFPEMKYDPEIGIFGMDISVVLERPGFSVKRRRIARRRIPHHHRITKEEGIAFFKERFSAEVIEE